MSEVLSIAVGLACGSSPPREITICKRPRHYKLGTSAPEQIREALEPEASARIAAKSEIERLRHEIEAQRAGGPPRD